MPLYDYKCGECKNVVEHYSHSMITSDEDDFVDTDCPKCSSGKLGRAIALPHAIVRGGGDWATAIRKDQVDFSPITMEEGFQRMSAGKGA